MPRLAGSDPSSSRPGPPKGPAGQSALRRRPAAKPEGENTSSRAAQQSSQGILRFYTDDAPGFKIGPTTVLACSLIFIGLVVILHIWGKFRS
mmetsp:Transcript_2601/g.3928  ORF Transcript_2601/g.3928 Transcript_2601/m.3928 type:complete len:92 (-) Transcript_2601:85-360(-)|eukprot:CAMPEP_0185023680 /NCGR_PEP_ID=MMETSP1103-20130426/6331_1 /TAXON_ID=36769 /ORGANISM="Paraphysomonas bandaiensis, Strain Caron Lab Isolate" /LENGTH=91 /DNA_ID=CAMNT_0027556387 /DNA_START=42 /DNA_END=317 /DNA_ORIENTATION=+